MIHHSVLFSTKKRRREETEISFWLDSGSDAYSEAEWDKILEEEKQVQEKPEPLARRSQQ
jgi:hypothetical protein